MTLATAKRWDYFRFADDPGTNSSWHVSYSPGGSKGSFPQESQVNEILEEWNLTWSNLDSMSETTANTVCTVLMFRGNLV